MTPLPASLGGGELVAWRLDQTAYAATWDNGEGARLAGGRWNSRGRRVVYCALDPATAILEVAVHVSFKTLDTVPYTLTSVTIIDPSTVHVVQPNAVPIPSWLRPGAISAGQQAFGDALLSAHKFVVVPSSGSFNSWNLLFDFDVANGLFSVLTQEAFALDTRLHPPTL